MDISLLQGILLVMISIASCRHFDMQKHMNLCITFGASILKSICEIK
jgi:hypothetical protein